MRYVVRITKTGEQFRITIPKGIIKSMDLEYERYLIIEEIGQKKLEIRRMYVYEKGKNP